LGLFGLGQSQSQFVVGFGSCRFPYINFNFRSWLSVPKNSQRLGESSKELRLEAREVKDSETEGAYSTHSHFAFLSKTARMPPWRPCSTFLSFVSRFFNSKKLSISPAQSCLGLTGTDGGPSSWLTHAPPCSDATAAQLSCGCSCRVLVPRRSRGFLPAWLPVDAKECGPSPGRTRYVSANEGSDSRAEEDDCPRIAPAD